MSTRPSLLTSRFVLVSVSGAASEKFGVTAMTPTGQLFGFVSAQVIMWTLSVPMFVCVVVPAKAKAIFEVGTACQALKAVVIPSIARCRVIGETPPTQVGLPLLQLLVTPWSLIFQAIGIAREFQATLAILVPLLTTVSRFPPARAEPGAAAIRISTTSKAPRRGGAPRRPVPISIPVAGRRRLIDSLRGRGGPGPARQST